MQSALRIWHWDYWCVPIQGAQLDCDAVRRVSFNVGAVAAVTATGLQLDAPLLEAFRRVARDCRRWSLSSIARVPASSRNGQRCLRWSRRAAAVYFHYPRLQTASPAEETMAELASGLHTTLLHAEFAAMASVDANDDETVVCYRSAVPAAGTPAY